MAELIKMAAFRNDPCE